MTHSLGAGDSVACGMCTSGDATALHHPHSPGFDRCKRPYELVVAHSKCVYSRCLFDGLSG